MFIYNGSTLHLGIEHDSSYDYSCKYIWWICYLCVVAVMIVIRIMKKIFGVIMQRCDDSFYCGDVQWPLILHSNKTVIHCFPYHIQWQVYIDIQSIQIAFSCMSSNGTSSWGNEMKQVAVVMDRLVSWFGGYHRERGDRASGCHNPFSSSLSLSVSPLPSLSPSHSQCVSAFLPPLLLPFRVRALAPWESPPWVAVHVYTWEIKHTLGMHTEHKNPPNYALTSRI